LHTANGGVIAHIQQRSNLTGGVEFVRLQFHGLFTSALLEAAAIRVGEQFVNVFAELAEVNLGLRLCRGGGHRRQEM
jgi:hypothetical protein